MPAPAKMLILQRRLEHPATVAHLFAVLAEGERVAANVAAAQSRYCGDMDSRLAVFFRRQARQEKFHNRAFYWGARCLQVRGTLLRREIALFDTLEHALLQALTEGRLCESVLGLQVILEALGEAFLETVDRRMDQLDMGFKRLRHTIRCQEQAHQDFGKHYFYRSNDGCGDALDIAADRYLAIVEELLQVIAPKLQQLELDPEYYLRAVLRAVQQGAAQVNPAASSRL